MKCPFCGGSEKNAEGSEWCEKCNSFLCTLNDVQFNHFEQIIHFVVENYSNHPSTALPNMPSNIEAN